MWGVGSLMILLANIVINGFGIKGYYDGYGTESFLIPLGITLIQHIVLIVHYHNEKDKRLLD